LVLANLPRAQAIGPAVEVSSKILDGADVRAYGSCRVVTSLEFFQHYFAKMGHGNTSCDPHFYASHQATNAPLPHAKRPPRQRLRSNALAVSDQSLERSRLPGTYPRDTQLDYFRIIDHPRVMARWPELKC
jgi:hypothetical protein